MPLHLVEAIEPEQLFGLRIGSGFGSGSCRGSGSGFGLLVIVYDVVISIT